MSTSLDGELVWTWSTHIWPVVATMSWEACESRRTQLSEGRFSFEQLRNIIQVHRVMQLD